MFIGSLFNLLYSSQSSPLLCVYAMMLFADAAGHRELSHRLAPVYLNSVARLQTVTVR